MENKPKCRAKPFPRNVDFKGSSFCMPHWSSLKMIKKNKKGKLRAFCAPHAANKEI